MRWYAATVLASALVAATLSAQPGTSAPPASERYFITPVADRRVVTLPVERPLYWRIETFESQAEAASRASDYALSATVEGRHWLFTLGPKSRATPGARLVAEVGPIPVPRAQTYLLRINHAGGPPGSQTAVHTHPGAEAIYVLQGEVTQRTRHGLDVAVSGAALNAHEAEMVMQLKSTGSVPLSQLVMFVVDADRPFSPPANF